MRYFIDKFKLSRLLQYVAGLFLAIGFVLAVAVYGVLRSTLPQSGGGVSLPGLSATVTVTTDRYGIPAISAENRLDAFRALGFLAARDRLFQMDLMRRKSAGQLAEIFGAAALESDKRARTLGFSAAAREIVAKLPEQYRKLLSAYAEGVNAFIAEAHPLPYEFNMLRYGPEPWRSEDSYLVILGMFDLLASPAEDEERMLTVMEQCLPPEVLAFLTPDTDSYTDSLRNHAESRRPSKPVPSESLTALLASRPKTNTQVADLVAEPSTVPGSNAWAVGAARTADGRAILANDMHLGLSLPNIWYRMQMHIGGHTVAGVVLPGVPSIIVGSNGRIAWGATNLSGDFIDLVRLEINPENRDEYRTPEGWRRFETVTETIQVKDSAPVQLPVTRTLWGPVAQRHLLGSPVAVHWTVLDAAAHNGELFDIDRAETLQAGLSLFNRAGGPPLNMLLADAQGHIAWTLMGKIPKRFGIDGSVSRSWADGKSGWNGYVSAGELPRQVDPPQGFLVSANDRRLGKDYPYVIGREFAGGYRAYRAAEALSQMQGINEAKLLALQLNVQTAFYDFYQSLALSVLNEDALRRHPELRAIRTYLGEWNGSATVAAKGLPLLTRLRTQLAKQVFAPFLTACRSADPEFHYSWTFIDTPLQALLNEKPQQLLPERDRYQNWDNFIIQQLLQVSRQLQEDYPHSELAGLTWGETNKAQIRHPFSRAFPWLGLLLDMPADELPGCLECLRVASPHFGASERMAVSPAHLDQGILHMPGGQASNPLSPNYSDQQSFWVKGEALALLSEKIEHVLLMRP